MNEISREEHLKQCKENAYKQYEFDLSGKEYSQPESALRNACITMLCDLAKHPETEKLVEYMIFMVMTIHTESDMKRFIDGFN